MILRLDAFRDDVQIELVRHADDRFDEGSVFLVTFDVLREVLVDLERIDREQLQVTEGGIPRPEIIDGEVDAESDEFMHRLDGAVCTLDDTLGQLEL